MGMRRHAREMALSILYETELQKIPYADILARIDKDDSQRAEVTEFLRQILDVYDKHKTEIDAEIEKHSNNWKLSRMACVDRNILRLGIAELKMLDDIPKSVTINEYLEIAKKYGTEDSSSFVNGILDKIEKRS